MCRTAAMAQARNSSGMFVTIHTAAVQLTRKLKPKYNFFFFATASRPGLFATQPPY